MAEERVLIAGAGPVGLISAARLVAAGVPVTVFEAGADLNKESRASTFHPSTLDMLTEVGASDALMAQGLKAPRLQYRFKKSGLIERFDFADIADLTDHPFRLQCEQWRLTRVLRDKLLLDPNFELMLSTPVVSVSQNESGVTVTLKKNGSESTRTGRWLIGADGANSVVRRTLEIPFEGFTWPERFLVTSTPFDFAGHLPDLDSVSYVADPECWHFLLRIPDLWRVMFPVDSSISDETALDPDYGEAMLQQVFPTGKRYEVAHRTLYRVHQRVAEKFRLGRAFLAGDAAHINNPLGGMGMNGGIHDAYNLTDRLAAVWHGDRPESDLDLYDLQRRQVTIEVIQSQTIQNKRDLEAATEEHRRDFAATLHRTAGDTALRRRFLKRVSMFASLERASQVGVAA